MSHYPLIRTIYLYLFTLIGLALITIGGVRLLDMGLKTFIFTKADEEERIMYKQPPYPYLIPTLDKIQQSDQTLSEEEKNQVKQMIGEYKRWQETRSKIDPVDARRQRDASSILAMILIGLPLYSFHWRIIKRETKNQNNSQV